MEHEMRVYSFVKTGVQRPAAMHYPPFTNGFVNEFSRFPLI